MQVDLKKVELNDKAILKHLWDLYSYDFSVYNNEDVLSQGDYEFYYTDDYFEGTGKACYFIMVDGKIGGFVSVSDTCYILNDGNGKCVADFFVMNKYRKGGVGRRAAYAVFDLYRGNWEVAQYDNNQVSKLFWQKVISDYTCNHFEKRTVFLRDYSLQAILFDSANLVYENEEQLLKKMDDLYHVRLYSRPGEDKVNELIEIAKEAYPSYDDVYKNLRRDLKYQDVIAIENEDEVYGFFIYTSIDGNAELTFTAMRKAYRGKGFAKALLRSFVQHMQLCGFEKITVDFDTMEKKAALSPLYEFYRLNGFKEAENRPELLEYAIEQGSPFVVSKIAAVNI